ncbi:uncharacterized protein LOC133996087 isoform X1 [Scomber scombrus]|uniref:uncharacterized protein LOC133996087 isoform X1 n=1 Tax=Scomber scombrus TaxID=13677 RepID=UPI002DD9B694|nr:uncharacterized protein LOC133996087 isoform X1 [Scomber scombrus]
MPYSCVYPGCGLKRKRYNPETFHGLPFRRNDPEILQQWLVVLKMDITTPVETLKKKRYRVCSRHFNVDDFIHYTKTKYQKKPTRLHLKRNTIPRVGTPAADIVELEDNRALMNRPQDKCRSIGVQVNASERCTVTTEKPIPQYLVDEEAIMQLMKTCPMCDRQCRCTKYTRGPCFIVQQKCYFCDFQRKWASQPEAVNTNARKAHMTPRKKLKSNDNELNEMNFSEFLTPTLHYRAV